MRIRYPYLLVRAHPRLFAGLALGIAAAYLLPPAAHLATRLLIAWNIGTWLYFILSAVLFVTSSPESMRRRAKTTDEGRFLILVLTSCAAIASIGAIVAQLAATKDMSGMTKGLHVLLAATTIVSSWVLIHLTYALHYAHEYFDEIDAEPGKAPKDAGGLKFPGTDDPDYFDFLYFSLHYRRRVADRGRRNHSQGNAQRLAGAFDSVVFLQQRGAGADDQYSRGAHLESV